ncbi:DUF2808 domain-containing protein [Nostoc sp. MS1]|uniref:DUF2808 domain-containing protein n=1 Tax=Nostoc sp. MS1 TaxID=2764711 RepID=UPI001CC5A4EC|nr:DUF2808 domain-containing protein [Nostoc sp. MS1]
MNRILIYVTAFVMASAALIHTDSVTAKTGDDTGNKIDNSLQLPSINWRIVKHTFQLRVPKNGKPLSQLIIDAPTTVAVSNDITVFDDQDQEININVSVDNRRIIIDFPEAVTSNINKLLIALNKVQQPINGADSVYNFSAKVVGSDTEIPVGQAQFNTF